MDHVYQCPTFVPVFVAADILVLMKKTAVSITELLQNWQHAQTPYFGQIWHAKVGQLSMLKDFISSG